MEAYLRIPGDEPLRLERRVSSVLFTGGCNLRCPTCHNWTLAAEPHSIERISRLTVIDHLRRYSRWIDGVVITGGEPTTVPHLADLISEIRELGFEINLHTNGLAHEVIRSLLEAELVDLFSVDVKGPWSLYPLLTGYATTSSLAATALTEVFDMASQAPELFYFRTTLVPALSGEHVEGCKASLPKGCKLHLQEFRKPIIN